MLHTFFFVSLTGFLFHDRFMPFRNSSRLRPWARRIQLRLLRLKNRLPPPRLELVALAQALAVPAVPPQAHLKSQIVLLRHSRSLLLVCWLPSVLPLACSEPSDVYQNMFPLGQRHYVLPHVFCFNYSGLHLRILLQPDNYHSIFCYILFVVYVFLFQPIPSLRLIYHSFLRTVMTVNLTMMTMWNHIPHQEMTKYTKYEASTQVGRCEHPILIYGRRPRHQHELQRHVVRLQVSEMTKAERRD